MEKGPYRIVRWTDGNGENKLAGWFVGERKFQSISYGVVEVPAGAEVFRPQRPEMVKVGEVN